VVQPDYEQMPEENGRITELCTIGGETYISVPDSIVLPEQPARVQQTLREVALTARLIETIAQASPHVRLMGKRIAENKAIRYSKQDEATLGFLSLFVASSPAFTAHVDQCRTLPGQG